MAYQASDVAISGEKGREHIILIDGSDLRHGDLSELEHERMPLPIPTDCGVDPDLRLSIPLRTALIAKQGLEAPCIWSVDGQQLFLEGPLFNSDSELAWIGDDPVKKPLIVLQQSAQVILFRGKKPIKFLEASKSARFQKSPEERIHSIFDSQGQEVKALVIDDTRDLSDTRKDPDSTKDIIWNLQKDRIYATVQYDNMRDERPMIVVSPHGKEYLTVTADRMINSFQFERSSFSRSAIGGRVSRQGCQVLRRPGH